MDWISVKEELPPLKEYVLLCVDLFAYNTEEKSGPRIFVGYRGNYGKENYDSAWGDGYIPFEGEDITHWMHLPNPPKQ